LAEIHRQYKHAVKLFGVEIAACARCGGKLKVIASIEEPQVIAKILAHPERCPPGFAKPANLLRCESALGVCAPLSCSSGLMHRQ
jgi:hypothetical protein